MIEPRRILAATANVGVPPAAGGARPVPRRGGFSLIELMIAVVILGLGMVLAATMFPVGWGRARRLAEFTTQATVTANVLAHLEMTAQVAGADFNSANFAGDLIFDPLFSMKRGKIVAYGDTRVHALNAENIVIGDPLRPAIVSEDPWRLERVPSYEDLIKNDPDLEPGPDWFQRSYYAPRLRIHDRFYPPLRPRVSEDLRQSDKWWDDVLENRLYAVAVLHRMKERVGPEPPPAPPPPGETVEENAARAISSTRSIDLYLVTLRRGPSTQRYAHQDTDGIPDVNDRTIVAQPKPSGRDDDLRLPVPWRVQVVFPDETVLSPERTGIPTEIKVNPTEFDAGPYVVDLLPEGTSMIDEITGNVYQVAQRRFLGVDQERATLTLDTEVLVPDIDDGEFPGDGRLQSDERLRTVWVFPPPVERGGSSPSFTGASPAIAVDVRTISLAP